MVADNHIGIRSETAFEIRSYGSDEDEEAIFRGGMHAHLCAGADEEWTDIKCGSTLVGGNPFLIEAHHLLHHFAEELGGEFWHEDAATGTLQTGCILLHAEDAYLAVGAAIGFQAFEGFLSVVETGGCHVKFKILIGADFNLAPFSIAIIASHVVIRLTVAERQTCPIDIFHFSL